MRDRPFAVEVVRTRLRAGDVIDYNGTPARVKTASPSCAVLTFKGPGRTFTTKAGRTVKLKPPTLKARISANADYPILSRRKKTP